MQIRCIGDSKLSLVGVCALRWAGTLPRVCFLPFALCWLGLAPADPLPEPLHSFFLKISFNLCHQTLISFNFALTSELWWSHSCSSLFSHPTEWQCAFCPESWLLFNTKCYYFSTNKLTWNKSRDFCTSMGGHLVIIESEEEQQSGVNFLLNTTAKTMDKSYWIGLTDQKIENKFFWVNNESLNENKNFLVVPLIFGSTDPNTLIFRSFLDIMV
uniref:C-type lectin domain-containing protein n=1 Tax=Erpetoichthys calabaricus TaxID=27687 RepID=A0A8C4T1R2_ERPCA